MTINGKVQIGCVLGALVLGGCVSDERKAEWFISDMDAKPPEEQVPNWESTRALMLRDAPEVGDEAPDFTLETRDGSESIRLSQFKGDRPVVLIFGSWT